MRRPLLTLGGSIVVSAAMWAGIIWSGAAVWRVLSADGHLIAACLVGAGLGFAASQVARLLLEETPQPEDGGMA